MNSTRPVKAYRLRKTYQDSGLRPCGNCPWMSAGPECSETVPFVHNNAFDNGSILNSGAKLSVSRNSSLVEIHRPLSSIFPSESRQLLKSIRLIDLEIIAV